MPKHIILPRLRASRTRDRIARRSFETLWSTQTETSNSNHAYLFFTATLEFDFPSTAFPRALRWCGICYEVDLRPIQFGWPGPLEQRRLGRLLGARRRTGISHSRAVAAIADGVGGLGRGEVASRLAVETAMRRFLEVKPGTLPRQALFKMLTAANTAVYDRSMSEHELGKMATTLTVALFRNNEINIGHVGDCRSFSFKEESSRSSRPTTTMPRSNSRSD